MQKSTKKHGGHLAGLRDDLSKGRGALYRLRAALHEADVMAGGPGYSQTRLADEIGLGIAWYRTCEREGKLPDNRAVRANIERLAKEAGVDLSEGE